MAATIPSTSLVPVQPVFTDAERLALAGYLAGCRGLTREACTLDLRQFTAWCRARPLPLFSVRRADTETFARELEALGRARATVSGRLRTIAGFYRYAVEEELLDHSPAAHVRRPRLDYESHATALDRNELGALLAVRIIGQVPRAEHDEFDRLGYTMGGMMVFPGNRVGGKPTLNAARGFNRKISDRMDLTLECVRRYYRHQDSPWPRTPRWEGNPPARALSRSSVTNQIPAWPILIVYLADDITRIRKGRDGAVRGQKPAVSNLAGSPLHDLPADPRPGRLLAGPEPPVKPVLIAILALTATLIVVMLVWIAPAVGTKNSACERYPLTSGCR